MDWSQCCCSQPLTMENRRNPLGSHARRFSNVHRSVVSSRKKLKLRERPYDRFEGYRSKRNNTYFRVKVQFFCSFISSTAVAGDLF